MSNTPVIRLATMDDVGVGRLGLGDRQVAAERVAIIFLPPDAPGIRLTGRVWIQPIRAIGRASIVRA